ncbi:MAG TPA: phosphotransferase [Bryobacteraceae bacterium]|jgi:Ser/Thr protein kinase RdoA (MazF antagonist)|nr:phosphotransferase [Bryobacteraceae bacterium]
MNVQDAWTAFFGSSSVYAHREVWAEAQRHFRLDESAIAVPLSSGCENLLFRVIAREDYVLRVSVQRSRSELEAEATFVTGLRRGGLPILPQFIRGNDGSFVGSACGLQMTMYRYIDGMALGTITTSEFDSLATVLEQYFIVLTGEVNKWQVLTRRPFPSPSEIIDEYLHIIGSRFLTTCRDIPAVNTARLRKLPPFRTDLLIHSDIHLGNLLWNERHALAGIIDFDDCAFGEPLLEFACIVRGCCFSGSHLAIDRLGRLWNILRQFVRIRDEEQIIDTLVVVCIYFFVAVNRERSFGPPRPVDWGDLEKASSVTQNVRALKAAIARDVD